MGILGGRSGYSYAGRGGGKAGAGAGLGLQRREWVMVGVGVVVGIVVVLLYQRLTRGGGSASSSSPASPPHHLQPKVGGSGDAGTAPPTPLSEGQGASDAAERVAKMLASKGVTAYVSGSCGWCSKQKAEFGDAWRLVPSVNCDANPGQCAGMGLPTWVGSDGARHAGYMPLARLEALFSK